MGASTIARKVSTNPEARQQTACTKTRVNQLRVVVSDGARSGSAESVVFVMPESPPEVVVESPNTGSVFGGVSLLMLSASARDVEDGDVDDALIRWSSSIDGYCRLAAG